ncbi:Fibronectin domain-containing protein [Gryllus bimaculatus]|nr:Fibronectin domain-containing protein [Gryllus bimaculatus]
MVCAPWAGETFACLANGVDHSPCCRARGLPHPCLDLCAGNLTQIDFSYFSCLKHMTSYTSCLLQGYGVLASAPRRVHVSTVDTTFALVHWAPPAALAESVREYAVRWRPLATYDNEYRAAAARRQPFVLEGLRPGADYEVYVEAVNAHGPGAPSARIVFRTESEVEEREEAASLFHNVTACCVEAALSGVCMPLCSYDASMADVKALAGVCAGELHKLLRCGAGGRDHAPCCARRGVPPTCAPVCAGVLAGPVAAAVAACAPYVGNIVQCFEEGACGQPADCEQAEAKWNGINVTNFYGLLGDQRR